MASYQYPIYPTETATWSTQCLWRPYPQEEVKTEPVQMHSTYWHPDSNIPTTIGDLGYPTPQQDPWLCDPEENIHPADDSDPSQLNSWWNPFPIRNKEHLQAVEEVLCRSTDNYWRLVSVPGSFLS